eukprot:EG_transcript_10475
MPTSDDACGADRGGKRRRLDPAGLLATASAAESGVASRAGGDGTGDDAVCTLSDDVWGHIADFLGAMVLSHVCSRLRSLLRRQYAACAWTLPSIPAKLAHLPDWAPLRWLQVTVAPQYSADRTFPMLRITPDEQRHVDAAIRSFAALPSLLSLRCLTLRLSCNYLWDSGVAALAELRHCLALTELTLLLQRNRTTTAGAYALGALKGLPRLQRLHIDLKNNLAGQAGANALVALAQMPTLQCFTLNLSYNRMALSMELLAMLASCSSSLTSLTLGLRPSLPFSSGVPPPLLADWIRPCHLQALCLDLAGSILGEARVQSLAGLRHSRTLTTLSLNLGHCRCGDPGLAALAALRETPSLRRLTLLLRGNSITDAGAMSLVALERTPPWELLRLDLCENTVSAAVQAELRRRLTSAQLDFDDAPPAP